MIAITHNTNQKQVSSSAVKPAIFRSSTGPHWSTIHLSWTLVILRRVACFLAVFSWAASAVAQVPDLRNTSDPVYPTATQIAQKSINLGPTGLSGWIYHEKDPKELIGDLNYIARLARSL